MVKMFDLFFIAEKTKRNYCAPCSPLLSVEQDGLHFLSAYSCGKSFAMVTMTSLQSFPDIEASKISWFMWWDKARIWSRKSPGSVLLSPDMALYVEPLPWEESHSQSPVFQPVRDWRFQTQTRMLGSIVLRLASPTALEKKFGWKKILIKRFLESLKYLESYMLLMSVECFVLFAYADTLCSLSICVFDLPDGRLICTETFWQWWVLTTGSLIWFTCIFGKDSRHKKASVKEPETIRDVLFHIDLSWCGGNSANFNCPSYFTPLRPQKWRRINQAFPWFRSGGEGLSSSLPNCIDC